MEDNEGVGGGDFGGDPIEQFHRNEAISAVVDEGFLGEEDDDFEDLYNDVNVGENFFQSMKKSEDFGNTSEVAAAESMPVHMTNTQTLPQPPPKGVPETAVVGGSKERTLEGDEGVSSARLHFGRVSEGYQQQNTGFGGQGIGGGVAVDAPGGSGLRVELGQQSLKRGSDVVDEHVASKSVPSQGGVVNRLPPPPATGVDVSGPMGTVGNIGNIANERLMKQGGINVNGTGLNVSNGNGNVGAGGGVPVNETGGGRGVGGVRGQGAMLFVGDLHWWTTDADLEAELSKYGQVKEVKFFDEKASGKSKGYCHVEFYDSAAASACKEGMNGHVFNGRPCSVAYASPFTIKRMGEAQVNRNQSIPQAATAPPGRRVTGDAPGRPGGSNMASGPNYQGAGDNNRGYGRGNWGRGNAQGMGGRGPVGPMRNRPGGMGGRGMMGNGGMGFGQGVGLAPPLLPPPQTMMGQGFDPAFGGPMGRMGGYGDFPGGPMPPFSGMMPSFPPVGSVGLPGVAPHVNPAFFGRGMPMSSMGMMPSTAIDGPNPGMWGDPSAGGWAGEEHGGRVGESSYGEEAVSDHQYGEVSHDRAPWPNSVKEKDRSFERDWSGSSERRYREDRGHDRDIANDDEWSERGHRNERDLRDGDRSHERDRERSRDRERPRSDRERERDRDRQRDDRDHYADHHRHKERGQDYDDEWDRGRSSRTHSKSKRSHEEEQRARSRDSEYGKRRRLTSDN